MNPMLIYVEVEENPNCEITLGLVYKAAADPRQVQAVRLYDDDPAGEVWEVVGWSSEGDGTPVPAMCALIEESGAGHGFLVWGSDWGIRLRRPGSGSWDLTARDQRGDTHFVLSDAEDIVYADATEVAAE